MQVANPEQDATYFWSNGTTGKSTTSTKSGPLSVYAIKNGCSTQKLPYNTNRMMANALTSDDPSQIDLPLNLDELGWVFPKGCYSTCERKPTGAQYILGPLGDHAEWGWQIGQTPVAIGSGEMPPYSDLFTGHDYQMFLNNGFGSATFQNMTLTLAECINCSLNYKFIEPSNIIIKDKCFTMFELCIQNPYSEVIYITLTVPTGEGFFTTKPNIFGGNTAIITLEPGSNCYKIFFYGSSGYEGGTTFEVLLKGTSANNEPFTCSQLLKLEMPYQCENAEQWKTKPQAKSTVFYIAPNPSQTSTTLYFDFESNNTNNSIEVIDMLGRIVLKKATNENSGNTILNIESLQQGTYIVRLLNKGKQQGQTKLIKN